MTPLLPPASIRRCSAQSRSFLLGPDGPAGAPPGQRLRSGVLIGLRENREQKQDPHYKVSTVRGEPRRRPYDLRHAAVSTWLNAGVPAPQVAEWAGHSVDVLLRVYARCIYGQQYEAKRRIEEATRPRDDD
jgi:integrase